MAEVLHAASETEAAGQVRADAASSYIATVYFKQAAVLLDQGQYAEAEGYFREVLRLGRIIRCAQQPGYRRLPAGTDPGGRRVPSASTGPGSQRFCDSE